MALRTFTVSAWIHVCAGVSIKAESFEEAVAKAKKLNTLDFVKVKEEFIDNKPVAIGWITDNSANPE